MGFHISRCLAFVCLIVGVSAWSRAASFTFTIIDVPGASLTEAFGINDAGQIVGPSGNGHGFLKDGATFTTIDVPDANSTTVFGINGAGQIVGSFDDANGARHGFLKEGANF